MDAAYRFFPPVSEQKKRGGLLHNKTTSLSNKGVHYISFCAATVSVVEPVPGAHLRHRRFQFQVVLVEPRRALRKEIRSTLSQVEPRSDKIIGVLASLPGQYCQAFSQATSLEVLFFVRWLFV